MPIATCPFCRTNVFVAAAQENPSCPRCTRVFRVDADALPDDAPLVSDPSRSPPRPRYHEEPPEPIPLLDERRAPPPAEPPLDEVEEALDQVDEGVPPLPLEKRDPFEGLDVPSWIKRKIRGELDRDERIVWVGRPSWRGEPLGVSANQLLFGLLMLLLALGCFCATIWALTLTQFSIWYRLAGVAMFGSVGMLFLVIGGVAFLLPIFVHLCPQFRQVYVVTTRCAMVFECIGWSARRYYPFQLRGMILEPAEYNRRKSDLIFDFDVTTRHWQQGVDPEIIQDRRGFLMLENGRSIERLVRATLLSGRHGVEPSDRERRPARALHLDEVPDSLRDRVSRVLSKRERLLWVGRPNPVVVLSRCLPLVFILLLLLVLFGLGGVAGLRDFVLHESSGNQRGKALWVGLLFSGLSLMLLWFILSLFGKAFLQMLGFYALTDRRAVVWSVGWLGRVKSRKYGPAQLLRVRREDSWYGYGVGDLIFDRKTVEVVKFDPDERVESEVTDSGFLAINDVRHVERLMRESLIEPFLQGVDDGGAN